MFYLGGGEMSKTGMRDVKKESINLVFIVVGFCFYLCSFFLRIKIECYLSE